MKNVLFVITSSTINQTLTWLMIGGITILAIALVAFLYQLYKKRGRKDMKDIMFVLIILIIVGSECYKFISQSNECEDLKEAYENGTCLYVEGEIHDYKEYPDTARWYEEFMVQDILFSYSNYEVTQAYNIPKLYDGVIQGNGQKVKIGYVFDDLTDINRIVYIEQL